MLIQDKVNVEYSKEDFTENQLEVTKSKDDKSEDLFGAWI